VRSFWQSIAAGFVNPTLLAPFYSLPPALGNPLAIPSHSLGKRAAMGLVQGGPGKSAGQGGAISAVVGAVGA